MDETVIDVERLKLKEDRELLSPPWLAEPLYQCATAVTVWGFVAHATVEVELDGIVVINTQVGFPEPVGPFTSQVYVHSANHNFFNRQWLDDDGVTPVIARSSHERILDIYGSALFRSRLLGHATERYLEGSVRPAGAPTGIVYLAYRVEDALTVDNHDDGNTISVNSLGRPTSATGGAAADEFPFDQVPGAFNFSFFGLTVGMVLQPLEHGADFRSEIGKEDLRDRQVWLRVAEVADDAIPKDGTGFELGLEDDDGTIGWISSDAVGGVPRPFERFFQSKTMLSTLRFNPCCAHTREDRLDLRRIVAVHLRSDRTDQRALAFDDLQLVTN